MLLRPLTLKPVNFAQKVIRLSMRMARLGKRRVWPRRYPEIKRLNLIYYVAPLACNHLWQVNLDRLRPHLSKFSKRFVAVVQGEGFVPFQKVREQLADWEIEWLVGPNDAALGEVTMFRGLLARIASVDRDAATFYGHTKGVSRPNNPAVALWRDAMYHACLDDLSAVKRALQGHACAGPFKKRGNQFDHGEVSVNHFHFAGAFFWFRHDLLFARADWEQIPSCRFGVEAYLGQFFKEDDAACLYGDGAGCLYEMAEWTKKLPRWRT